MNIKQIKLTNGDEIICDIVEEYEEEMIVRKVLKLLKVEISSYTAYYTFRPWMTMKNNIEEVILINPYHIICAANPSPELYAQYEAAVATFDDEEEQENEESENIQRDSDTNVISIFKFEKDKMH